MKGMFLAPALEVVRFVEEDIVVCSACMQQWQCDSYGINCTAYDISDYCEIDVGDTGQCLNVCTLNCSYYTLDEEVVGNWGDGSPASCEQWMADCEGYSWQDSSFHSYCSSFFCTSDVDIYGGPWNFAPNDGWTAA